MAKVFIFFLAALAVSVKTEPELDTSCLRYESDFPGADMRNMKTETLNECAKQCQESGGCKSITYSPSDKNCWLKNKRGGDSGPVPKAGLHSMNIDCSSSKRFDASDLACAMDNWDFEGADMRNFKAPSFEACAIACHDAAECRSITFRKSDNHCWLKSEEGGNGGPSPKDGLLSRNLQCDNSPLPMHCRQANTDFAGADLRNFKVDNIQSCANACRMSQHCQSITYRLSDKNCWLKNKRGGENGPSSHEGLISMNNAC